MKQNNKIGITQWAIPVEGPYACKIMSELGLDGIQLSGGLFSTGFHISQNIIQKSYIEAGKKYNISFPSIAPIELDFSSIFAPKTSKEAQVASSAIKISVDAASNMGVPLVMAPTFAKSLIKNKSDFDYIVEVFKTFCDYAIDKNVIIASENTLSADENLELIEKVQRSNFKLYMDTQNPYLHKGCDVSEMIEKLFPHIAEVHVKDGKNKELSAALLGQGDTGFYKSIDTLKKLGYSGWIVLENYYDREPLRLQNENYLELIKQDIEILKAALK